jgi:hypothetical protein
MLIDTHHTFGYCRSQVQILLPRPRPLFAANAAVHQVNVAMDLSQDG